MSWFQQNKKSMEHKTHILTMTPAQAGELVGALRYDALKDFLMALSNKLASDGITDHKEGKPQLSKYLNDTSIELYNAGRRIEKAWKISEPHIKKATKE